MSRSQPIRVLKLGGSVLDRPGYATALGSWLSRHRDARTLILVGGGRPVDAIRELAAVNHYPDALLHWLCIDLMDASYRLVTSQLNDWPCIATASQLESWLAGSALQGLVHVRAFYPADNNAAAYSLPIGWDTTSDSLAALLALVVEADELVLIKSCKVSEQPVMNWQQLAERGMVDRAFPAIAAFVKQIRITQLD